MLSTLSCAFIVHFCLPFLGDGANDVSMIQAADVGIGISGQEGMQVSLQFTSSSLLSNRFLLINKFHSSPVLLMPQVGIITVIKEYAVHNCKSR